LARRFFPLDAAADACGRSGESAMKFGIFLELQIPKPWGPADEMRLVEEALAQVELADRLGIDHAWVVEHHFLEEYSHCSASDLFLAAAAARTRRIRVGFGIRQVIAKYNHPSSTAEAIAMLDLISGGRAEFGFGEGATRLELAAFGIPAKEKRAWALEAAEQIANMMVMSPYPGFEGRSFDMPCRNVVPKPLQKPHPPMWMACTNRDTIRVAASLGVGALAFSFVDPEEALTWSRIYYDTIRSEACVPLGHSVNANIALVSAFSLHRDHAEAVRRAQENQEFFAYAMAALVTKDNIPGRTRLWDDFQAARAAGPAEEIMPSPGIGTPDELRAHVRQMEACGIDQIVFIQQCGRARHEQICDSLELFAAEVLDEFRSLDAEQEARKQAELAPYIAAALRRKRVMRPLADDEIPPVRASVKTVQVGAAVVDPQARWPTKAGG
jgi:alkanesulfonate monooxygenase SsuD/methylene tetrahydromethanopterin reductase-like flavin-dependent oxidoreductase (luciferase family)